MAAAGSRSGSIAPSRTSAFFDKLVAGEKFLKWTDQVKFIATLQINYFSAKLFMI